MYSRTLARTSYPSLSGTIFGKIIILERPIVTLNGTNFAKKHTLNETNCAIPYIISCAFAEKHTLYGTIG